MGKRGVADVSAPPGPVAAAFGVATRPVRLASLGLAVALVAAALPFLSLPLLLVPWVALGLLAALPGAANAAADRGHELRKMTAANPLHRLRRGVVLRVALHGALGLVVVAVLLVRLSVGGVAVWLGTLAGVAAVAGVLHAGRGLFARGFSAGHAEVYLRRVALWGGILAVMVASALAVWTLGPSVPDTPQAGHSALVAEAFAAHRLWTGVEAWALGAVSALNLLPALLEALLAAALLGASGWAVAALSVAALMPLRDVRRAVAAASDAFAPPAPHRAAFWTAGAVAVVAAVGALWAEHRLNTQPAEARPVAQVQIAAEQIGGAYFPAGTHAAIAQGRDRLAALDAAALADLRVLTEAGFDTMLAQVDPFLDEYYSLRGEYTRIGVSVWGWVQGDAEAMLADHLNARLNAALDAEAQLRPMSERLASLGLAEAQSAQAAREAALLDTPLRDINPALLRIEGAFPAFDPLPELRSTGLVSTLEARVGGAVAVGVLGAVVARRVLQRLVARGVLRLGARAALAAVPLLGGAVAVGADEIALRVEEHYNRAAFRAEIIAAVNAQRAEVLAALE